MRTIAIVAAAALAAIGCVLPQPVPTQPDAGPLDADGGVCSGVHGDCDPCAERCRELAADGLVLEAECLGACS